MTRNQKLLRFVVLPLVCLVVAVPLVGFCVGVVHSDAEGLLDNLMIGVISGVITSLSMGFVWVSTEQSVNGWPYILPLMGLIYVLGLYLVNPAARKRIARRARFGSDP